MTEVLVASADGLHRLSGGRRTTDLSGHAIGAVAVEGDGRWALVDGQVWSTAPGQEWQRRTNGGPGRPTCLLPTPSGLLVGSTGAHLGRLMDDHLEPVASFDRISQRSRWYTPWGAPADTRSLAAGVDGTLYVNVHVGGILRSLDGGASWQPTIDIDTDVHQVAVGSAVETVFAATGAEGLAVSHDRGDRWTFHHEGLHGRYLRAVAVMATSAAALVTASTGPAGGRAGVYRWSLDGSSPFQRCQNGLPEWFAGNIDTFCLDALDATAAFGTADGRVYVSEDRGSSWALAAEHLPPVRQVRLLA